MTDKEKIRAEIERQINEMHPAKEKIGIVGGAAVKRHLESILSFIDSMQEEPVSKDIQKVGSLKSLEYYPEKKTTNKTSKGVFDANMPRRKAYLRGFKDGAHAHKELIANKSVSEDLDSFAINYAQDKPYPVTVCQAVKVGANWQLNKLRKKI